MTWFFMLYGVGCILVIAGVLYEQKHGCIVRKIFKFFTEEDKKE